ncbi:MAG: hypothetical protein GY873_30065 [Bosea sp.]|nr:hypothetical protein [Bosea sp. (in: a-proteobacteria)]MCP4738441.1 hypothetical protein [Bosea sp. (in: a-proteobacteria)]
MSGYATALAAAEANRTDAAWAVLRAERNLRLVASDWTQMPDAPLSEAQRAAWVAYRQALRDLPGGLADPAAVSWPEAPAA